MRGEAGFVGKTWYGKKKNACVGQESGRGKEVRVGQEGEGGHARF